MFPNMFQILPKDSIEKGGWVSDNNATSWAPTDQLKLNWGQLSWWVGAKCGNKRGCLAKYAICEWETKAEDHIKQACPAKYALTGGSDVVSNDNGINSTKERAFPAKHLHSKEKKPVGKGTSSKGYGETIASVRAEGMEFLSMVQVLSTKGGRLSKKLI